MARGSILSIGVVAMMGCGSEVVVPPGDTVDPVEIVSFSPQGEVPRTQPIRVQFSRAMVAPETVGAVLTERWLSVSPAVPGQGRWTTIDTYEWTPVEPFKPCTAYDVSVREEALGADRRLVRASGFRFHTPLFRLLGADIVAREGGMDAIVEFSHPVRPEAARSAVGFFDLNGRPLGADLPALRPAHILQFRLPEVKAGDGVEVRVQKTLRPSNGGGRLGKLVTRRLVPPALLPFQIERLAPIQEQGKLGIALHFTAAINTAQARSFVGVAPKVSNLRFDETSRGFKLYGDFAPGQSYTVTVKANLPARDTRFLEGDDARVVTMPEHLDPWLRFVPHSDFLQTRAQDAVSLEVVNIRKLRVRVRRIFDENLVHVLPSLDPDLVTSAMGEVIFETELQLSGEKNQRARVRLPRPASVKIARRGLDLIEVEDAERRWLRRRAWWLARGLGLSVKRTDDYLQTSTFDLDDLTPADGVQVTVVSQTNQILGRRVSARGGLAEFRIPLDRAEAPAWVIAFKPDQVAYLPLEKSRLSFGLEEGRTNQPASDDRGFVYTDQDVYRTGETVHVTALVRTPGLTPAPINQAKVSLLSADGRAVVTESMPSGTGFTRADLRLPPTLEPGSYRVAVVASSARFSEVALVVVGAQPDALVADVSAAADATAGQPTPFQMAVRSRFQTPLEGYRVEARCTYQELAFASEAYPNFRFAGSASGKGARLGPVEVRLPSARLDRQGKATLACPPRLHPEAGGPVEVILKASVAEPNGRPVSVQSRVQVPAGRHYVGTAPVADEPSQRRFLVVDPNGRPMPNVLVQARVYAVDPSTLQRKGAPLANLRLTSSPTPEAMSWTAPTAGRYRWVLRSAEGAMTHADVWVFDSPEGANGSSNRVKGVEVLLPPGTAAVGTSVPVRIRAPFTGRLRLTVERERILHSETLPMEQRDVTIPLTIGNAYMPNAYLVAEVIHSGADGVQRAVGATSLAVDPAPHRLAVQISAPEQVSLSDGLSVKIEAGPASSSVRYTLSAVSRRRWLRGADTRRNPFLALTAYRGLSLTSHDGFAVGSQREHSAPGETEPVTPILLRSSSEGVPQGGYWSGVLETDSQGAATVQVPLQGLSGPTRIMVVAFGNARFGLATKDVEIVNPVRVEPGRPGSLMVNDTISWPVRIHNGSSGAATMTASVSVTGPLQVKQPVRPVSVPGRGATDLAFDVTAVGAGPARFLLTVSTGAHRASVQHELQVESPFAPAVRGWRGTSGYKAPARLPWPPELAAPEARARLAVGPDASYGYLSAMDRLQFGYAPSSVLYVARALGLLATPHLARVAGLPEPFPQLQNALRSVEQHVTALGALARWAEGPASDRRDSLWMGFVLVEAVRQGVSVDRDVYQRMLGQLQATASGDKVDRRLRAAAAYVLARAGRASSEVMTELSAAWFLPVEAQPSGLSDEERAWLAGAMMLGGLRKEGRKLLVDAFAPGATPLETLATLTPLLRVAPSLPSVPPLMTALESDASTGGWASPLENAVGLWVISRYYRQPGERPYWATLTSNDEVLRRMSSTRGGVWTFASSHWADREVRLATTGAGVAYAGMSAYGRLRAHDSKPQTVRVSRTVRTVEGKPLSSPELKRGQMVVVEVNVERVKETGYRGPVRIEMPGFGGLVMERMGAEGLSWAQPTAPMHVENTPTGWGVWADLGSDPIRLYYSVRALYPGRFRWRGPQVGVPGRTDVKAQGALETWTIALQ